MMLETIWPNYSKRPKAVHGILGGVAQGQPLVTSVTHQPERGHRSKGEERLNEGSAGEVVFVIVGEPVTLQATGSSDKKQ